MGVDFDSYKDLSPEKQDLIDSWFRYAWDMKNCNETQCFRPFISAWIAFNSWGAYVTEKDSDSSMIKALEKDKNLNKDFKEFLHDNPLFHRQVESFYNHLPIVKVLKIRQLQREIREMQEKSSEMFQETEDKLRKWQIPSGSEPIEIERIFKARFYKVNEDRESATVLSKIFGKSLFSPSCWAETQDEFGKFERNWTNTLQSIYQVRCNLFHGHKSALVPADQQIVLNAFRVMVHSFYCIFSKRGVINSEHYDPWLLDFSEHD